MFAKYVGAIMAIVLVGFLVLATVMTALVSRYALQEKETLIQTTAENTAESIYAYKRLANTDLFHSASYREEVQRMIDRNAKNADSVIFLTTPEGTITLLSENTGDSELRLSAVPGYVIESLFEDSDTYDYSDLGGVFAVPHTNYFFKIVTEDEFGNQSTIALLFISSLSMRGTGVVQYMSGTLLVSMLWVTLAALSATYVISNRITQPLKNISRAAKEFAGGNFNVRVPVRGAGEVAELCETFNAMAETLSQQEALRNTFIGNVSHDLRTPMTTISGFIDGILDGAIPPEKQNHYLSLIASEVRRLSRLVGSLLDISRMESGDRKYHFTVFDLCESARQILISFEKRVEDKRLEVEFTCDEENMTVYADKDAIHQVVYNLCDNAIKFASEGGELKIRITYEGKRVRLSVYDTGIGIPVEDQPYIFDRFYKSDRSRGLDKTGTGLGLFIAQSIVKQHGDRIVVQSEPGKNCEMSFTLPSALTVPGAKPNNLSTEE